jgi:hypothetical protein
MNPDYPHAAPLFMDYHPRDIRLVLEHCALDRQFRFGPCPPRTWQETLADMERDEYERDLDLLPGVPPTDRDTFWKVYAEIPKNRADFQRICYARVLMGRGISRERFMVQYWYAYFYNDFWNTHEMDWEAVNIVFKLVEDRPIPTICALSAHHGGGWLPWSQVEKALPGPEGAPPERHPEGHHPVIYVANGSLAGYFHGPALYITAPPLAAMAGERLKSSRRLVDYTCSWDEGSPQLVPAQLIPDTPSEIRWNADWRWLNQKGRWGSRGKWYDLEFGDSGPLGLPQCGDPWNFPFRWIDTSFTRAPSRQEALMPTLLEPGAI